ncbi:unannotated protein [freshwater metagenome]|uniref:Unannotated protein n=1 Tax=freshwater metagenome TaxID=449393 RepID=A0A6J7M227_9ZZZZ
MATVIPRIVAGRYPRSVTFSKNSTAAKPQTRTTIAKIATGFHNNAAINAATIKMPTAVAVGKSRPPLLDVAGSARPRGRTSERGRGPRSVTGRERLPVATRP